MKQLHKRMDALEARATQTFSDLSAWTDEQLMERLVEIHEELVEAGCPLPDDWREIVNAGRDHSLNPIIQEWERSLCKV